MNIILAISFVLGIPISFILLKRIFKESIKYTLSVSFIIVALLCCGMYYIATNLQPSCIIIGAILSASILLVLFHWLNKELIEPIQNTINSINNFVNEELGIDIEKTRSGNELKMLHSSILNLTNDFKSMITEVQKNVLIIQKYSQHILYNSDSQTKTKSTNTPPLKKRSNLPSENGSAYIGIIDKTEVKKSDTANNQILYKSFSIN
jgi:hypothetical protein